ncbi:flagella basal body P-ring formation protein FlgA [Candidatus Marinamargulisbacteria bacterium SCGC AAA071-K20]|nr:flagella basal body P-ring formation protein FlgA [Candidatus Marinamargulisbacteria bacterium SCGC AAA071-K20]
MILSRFFLLALVLTTTVFAGSLSFLDIDIAVKTKLESKVQLDYPMISKNDIEANILNKDILSDITPKAVGFTYDIPEKSNVLGRTVIPLKLLDSQGHIIETKQVLSEVKAFTLFHKSKRLVKRGEVIDENDLNSVKLNMANYSKRQLMQKEDIIGKETKSSIAKDTIFGSWMIRDVPTIRQGAMVNLIFSENGLHLKAKGRALDDGFIGGFIRVQSSYKANKIIIGEVLNETNVKVSILN